MSSATWLSLGTIATVLATALLAISFATDNWKEIHVERKRLLTVFSGKSEVNTSEIYFDRFIGLWRVCFPTEIPAGYDYYHSPTDTYCGNIVYPRDLSEMQPDEVTRAHMMRTTVGFYIAAFVLFFLSFYSGVAGCWRRSPGYCMATGLLIMFGGLLCAGGIGLWHGVEYLESERLTNAPFYRSWNSVLRNSTTINYGWSYVVSWIGVGSAILAAFFIMIGSCILRGERTKEKVKSSTYFMPVYADSHGGSVVKAPAPTYYTPHNPYPGPYQYYYNYNGTAYRY